MERDKLSPEEKIAKSIIEHSNDLLNNHPASIDINQQQLKLMLQR